MKNQFKFFAKFSFWYIVIFVLKTVNFRWFFTITRKIRIEKIEKLIFHSIQFVLSKIKANRTDKKLEKLAIDGSTFISSCCKTGNYIISNDINFFRIRITPLILNLYGKGFSNLTVNMPTPKTRICLFSLCFFLVLCIPEGRSANISS